MSGYGTTLNGNISGSGALNLNNSGVASTLTLSGTNSGYSGTITFNNNNAVSFTSANAGSSDAAWVFNDVNVDRVRINIAGGGTINFGAMSGSGQIQNDTGSTTSTISVGALNTNTTFSGTMKDNGSGILALTKVGTGTLTLAGANSYSGGTTISGGTLQAGNASAFGTGAIALSNASGTLDLNGNSIGNILTVNAAGTLANTNALSGALTKDANVNSNFTVNNSGDITTQRLIGSNVFTITKTGAAPSPPLAPATTT